MTEHHDTPQGQQEAADAPREDQPQAEQAPEAAAQEQAAEGAETQPQEPYPWAVGEPVAWTASGRGNLAAIEERGGERVGIVSPGGGWSWHPGRFFTMQEDTGELGVPIRLADLRPAGAERPSDEEEALDAENERLRARVAELEAANEELRERVEELEAEEEDDEDAEAPRRQLPPVKNFEGRITRIERFTRRSMGFAKDAACDMGSVSTELFGPGAREAQIAYHNGDWDALAATLKNAKDNIEGVAKDAKDAGKALKLVADEADFLEHAVNVHYADVLNGQGRGRQTRIDDVADGRHKESQPSEGAPPAEAAGAEAPPPAPLRAPAEVPGVDRKTLDAHGTPATWRDLGASLRRSGITGEDGALHEIQELGAEAPALTLTEAELADFRAGFAPEAPPADEGAAGAPAQGAPPATGLTEAQRKEAEHRGLTPEQIQSVDAALRADPKVSQVQLAKTTGVERTKLQRVLKAEG